MFSSYKSSEFAEKISQANLLLCILPRGGQKLGFIHLQKLKYRIQVAAVVKEKRQELTAAMSGSYGSSALGLFNFS